MTICPCCKKTETVSFKKSSLTYRSSNTLIENKHPSTPTESLVRKRRSSKPFDRNHSDHPEFVFATPIKDLPHYTSAMSRYTPPSRSDLHEPMLEKKPSKKILPGKTKSDQRINQKPAKPLPKKTASTPTVQTGTTANNSSKDPSALPDDLTDTQSLQHFGEERNQPKKKYYKGLIEAGPEGRGLTRAERDIFVEMGGGGKLLDKFSHTGGKFIKKRVEPPKKRWKFPTVLVWKARQKFLSKKKIKEILAPEPQVVDKLIDEGKKWHKKQKIVHPIIPKPRPKPEPYKPTYFDTKIDGKPVLASFGKKNPNLVGHSNYTCPESIPRMLKGYCMIEPFEPGGNNSCPTTNNPDNKTTTPDDEFNHVGTQIRNPCLSENYATHNLPTVNTLSTESLGCLGRRQEPFNHPLYSHWPNYTRIQPIIRGHNLNPYYNNDNDTGDNYNNSCEQISYQRPRKSNYYDCDDD